MSLLQRHRDLVHTVIAHEPPLAELLPDRDEILRETTEMVATYLSGDRVGAWRQFLASADIDMPPEVFEMIFGGAIEGQAAADERFSFAHMEFPTTFWQPDLAALAGAHLAGHRDGRGLGRADVRPDHPRAGRRSQRRARRVSRRPHRVRRRSAGLRPPTP